MAKVNIKGLEKFARQLNKLNDEQINQFNESAIKELAARLLRKVISRTPVGQYKKETGKKGGTLRRGWTAGKENANKKGNVIGVGGKNGFANNIEVTKQGNSYVIKIINPVEYASYVEFGHLTRDHKNWVEGQFMLTISEQELEQDAPRILENKLKGFLEGIFNA